MKDKSFGRREELLDAALDEFSRKSYADASLNSIIKAAGISKGTFYYHFENKEQLYLTLLDSAVKAKWAFIHSKARTGQQASGDIFEMFALQAELGLQYAQAEPRRHMLYSMFVKEKDDPVYKKARLLLEGENEHALEDMIGRTYDAGAFKKAYSREFVVRIVGHMLSDFNELFLESGDADKLRKSMGEFIMFLKTGLAK